MPGLEEVRISPCLQTSQDSAHCQDYGIQHVELVLPKVKKEWESAAAATTWGSSQALALLWA